MACDYCGKNRIYEKEKGDGVMNSDILNSVIVISIVICSTVVIKDLIDYFINEKQIYRSIEMSKEETNRFEIMKEALTRIKKEETNEN